MRIKLDENLPESLLVSLASLGHEVDSARLEGLTGKPDPEVWQAAQKQKRFFITQDLDFSDVRKFAPGTHEGLLLIRLRLPSRLALARRLLEVFRSFSANAWSGCFVLVTDRKVRIRKPASSDQAERTP